MRLSLAFSFVIAVTTAALGQSDKRDQKLDLVADRDAHAIYAAVVPGTWALKFKEGPIVLQRETEDVATMMGHACSDMFPSPDPGWVEVEKHVRQENARRKVLPLALPISNPYLVIALAEIERIDAPVKLKYPHNYLERPEIHQHVAVSAVGFSSDRTKAMVYASLPDEGAWTRLERRNGKWITHSFCKWIA